MHGENLHWGSLGSIKNNSSVLNLYWKASENRVQTVQVHTVSFPARSAGAEMKSLQPLKAYSMKRPYEEANAGLLQPVRRVRRKTPGAEVQPGLGPSNAVCRSRVCSRGFHAGSLQLREQLQSSVIRWFCSSKRCRLKLPTEFQMQKQQRCQGAG